MAVLTIVSTEQNRLNKSSECLSGVSFCVERYLEKLHGSIQKKKERMRFAGWGRTQLTLSGPDRCGHGDGRRCRDRTLVLRLQR